MFVNIVIVLFKKSVRKLSDVYQGINLFPMYQTVYNSPASIDCRASSLGFLLSPDETSIEREDFLRSPDQNVW